MPCLVTLCPTLTTIQNKSGAFEVIDAPFVTNRLPKLEKAPPNQLLQAASIRSRAAPLHWEGVR